jgi:hypothetical protein
MGSDPQASSRNFTRDVFSKHPASGESFRGAVLRRSSRPMTPAIRGGKGEFLIATFNDATLLKIWTVKEKHIKKLGLYSGLVR